MALLEVRDLQKWYGKRQVVCGVDFEVERGQVVGLLGPNGAGKTTSFRMTIGLISADGGRITFNGKEITHLPMFRRARAGLGYLPQETSVFRQLSVENNLMAILETRSDLGRRERRARRDQLLDQFGLDHIRKTKAQFISGGEKRRLEIARCLITEPSLIMLDEPFAGIDPKTVKEIQVSIRELAEAFNIGILLTDHEYRETLEVTDYNYLIYQGRVVARGNRVEFLENPDVRRYYLGERTDVGHLLERPPHVPPSRAVGQAPESSLTTSPSAAPAPTIEPAPAPSPAPSPSPIAPPPIPVVDYDPLLDAFGPVILDPSFGQADEDDDAEEYGIDSGPSSR
ncbi:LPS export ABC transporter ATP-binding protein [Tautonia sociabilis]|uniref:LPS export ABC transporter ATP-binding protein n=1 Tax=Tautonia sociabilis TaxID=2080755 RepID=UPI0018F5EE30|nr:LPS export ABC transporter ATP-binding protein [Tautonia sociabilis]